MNRVCLIGRLTAKPELKFTGSNIPVTRFTLAVNRSFTNAQGQREADFISMLAWRKQAELICNYFNKGSLIGIEGRIQTGSYDKDGTKVYTTEVVVDSIHFLESKNASQNREFDANESSPYDYQDTAKETNNVDLDSDPFADFGDSVSIDDNFLD
ncbi:MAG: single-stranded DNA-binding protein [Clostridiaceae bacterium]|nr:single-stranded DNA-binding protein [Clostridiaceae bacterium]